MSKGKFEINGVKLNTEQISEGFSHLYDKYGLIIQLWSEDKKEAEIINYWKEKVKK